MIFRPDSKILHLKQTLLFIIFGLIIGYFSFVNVTFMNSLSLLNSFKQKTDEVFFDTMEQSDRLYHAFMNDFRLGEIYLERLHSIIPNDSDGVIQYHLYMKDSNTGNWIILHTSSNSLLRTQMLLDSSRISSLNKALDKGIHLDILPFTGDRNRKNIYIDVSSVYDQNHYVIQLSHMHSGILNYIQKEKDTFIIFSLFVLIISALLGFIFAGTLSRPIKDIADKALIIASGNMDVDLHCHRLDEIGLLYKSMKIMADNIQHRIKTMQTMNKIDRAVVSSVSRKELLYKVAALISDQFDKAGISVLEKIENGYMILATAPKSKKLEGQIILEAELPEDLRKNASIPFEFSMQNLAIEKQFVPDGTLMQKIFSIPLFQAENFVGVFVISLQNLSDQDREALKMLSDQTGVALKSFHDVKKKEDLYQALLLSLTRSVDAKSRWTAGHSDRVAELGDSLCREMNMGEKLLGKIHMGALLHDIGKIGIPETILDKPGRLTDDEFSKIKDHPLKGFEILSHVPDFDTIRQIVRSHHERWDGTGYPDGLAGEEIPFAARIIAIADVFDAITEDRPYRKGFTIEETRRFMTDQRGKLFDPELLDLFLQMFFTRSEETVQAGGFSKPRESAIP